MSFHAALLLAHAASFLLGSEVYEIRGIRELGRQQGLEFKAKAWAGTDQQ